MNYARIYEDFIADRRSREAELLASGVYVERHHIKPRSLGGGDEPENLVALTARDHYFAHVCLALVHGGNQWISVHAMSFGASFHERKDLVNKSRWFAVAREKARAIHAANTSRQHAKNKEYRAIMWSDEVNAKRSATMKAWHETEEGRAHARSEKRIAAATSVEAIEKRSASIKEWWNTDAGAALKKDRAEMCRKRNSDPAFIAKISGDNNARRRFPEKWANAVEKMKGEGNPTKRPEVAAMIAARKKERDALRKEYFERSGFTGNRRTVKMEQVTAWLKKNPA